MKAIGERVERSAPYGMEAMVWSSILDTLERRGQRMIPWRSGQKGSWSLSDRFEEIYLDEYSRNQVDSL